MSRARPGIAAGLRAGLLTTAPLLLAPLLGRSGAAFMGLAGFGTTLVDKGGSYRARLAAMSGFGAAGALGVLAATKLAPEPFVAVPFLFATLLAAGYVRVLGAEAAAVGVFVGVDIIICLSRPLPDTLASAEAAGFFLLGNLWAQALALGVWPLQPYRPARLALAQALEALADVAAALGASSVDATPEGQRSRRALLGRARSAIESARGALDTTRRGRSAQTRRGARLLLAVENADVLFGALITLEDELTRGADRALAAWVAALMPALPPVLRDLARGVIAEEPAHRPRLARPRPGEPWPPPIATSQAALGALVTELAPLDDPRPAPAARTARMFGEERPGLGQLLGDHLTLRSAYLRHALRAACAAVAAHALSGALALSHGYWSTLTCFVIMQPQGSATTAKALQRVLGTLLGAGIAIVVASSVSSVAGTMAAVFGCVALGVALLPLNYGAYAVFLTPGFVLLAEHAAGDAGLAWVRVLNTLLGASIALLCARFLLPFSERDQFRPLMGEAFARIAGLARELGEGGVDEAALHRARRKVGLALLNAEASHQRLISEAELRPEESEALSTMLLYAHRVTALLTVLASARDEPRADVAVVSREVARTLAELAQRVRARTDQHDLAEPLEGPREHAGETPTRLAHLRAQLGVLVRAVARFERAQSAFERSS